ncbi:MAG: class I SAM-dependent methyltransferase [Elusimicrobiota bacterium]
MTAPAFETRLLSRRLDYPPSRLFRNPLTAEQTATRDRVLDKLARGEYALEAASCFCGGGRFRVLAEVDRYRLPVRTVLCLDCGLLQTNPRMNQDSYARFYAEEYRPLYEGPQDDLERSFAGALAESRKALAFVKPHLPPLPGLVMELGANMGATLSLFQQLGWEARGADYGRAHIEAGRKLSGVRGLEVGGLDRLEQMGVKADLFVLQHVFEHFLDLPGQLSRIRSLIKPDGLLFVEVPGLYDWVRGNCSGDFLGYLQNAHVYHFTSATLDYVLGCAGFERVASDDYIRSLYRPREARRPLSAVPAGEAARTESFLRAAERRLQPRLALKCAAAALGLLKSRDAARGVGR